MATLQESANSILNEKQVKIIPENIKQGVTIFGVTGVVEEGYSMISDATAAKEDILAGKTAYINGGKVTGTLEISDEVYNTNVEVVQAINDKLVLSYAFPKYIKQANLSTSLSKIGEVINLTPEMIVKGYTVLGVSGSAGISQTIPYASLEELNNIDAKEGDIAVIATAETYEGTYQYKNGAWVEIFSSRQYANTLTPEDYLIAENIAENIEGGNE